MRQLMLLVHLIAWGGIIHEYTHAAIARYYGADTVIDWGMPVTLTMFWRKDSPTYGKLLAHMGPFFIGYPLGVAIFLFVDVSDAPLIAAYVLSNLLLYAYPTKNDRGYIREYAKTIAA